MTREPRMRTDALRNRDRIIAAARDAFVEDGPDVPLDTLAQRAGVGNATLYRHFPDRHELVLEVTLSTLVRIVDYVESALAEEPDAFEVLRRFVHRAADERIGSLSSLLCDGFEKSDPRIVGARERLEHALDRVMDRARRSGQLRADIARGDLLVAVTQLTRPVPGTRCVDFDQFIHRHLQLFLDGLHTPARSSLPGAAATLEDLQRRNV